jgi:KDO2-lipid IV(A) lauroyltransferase
MKSAREIRHDIEYDAVRGALFLAGSLPIGIARGIGSTVGFLAYALGIRRAVSIANITRGLGASRGEAARVARRAYCNFGRCLMEFAAFRRWSQEDMLRLVEAEGLEHMRRALADGRGAIIVGAHLGNWEMAGAVLTANGLPLSFLVGEQTNARVDDVVNNLRRAQRIGIITRASALKKVLTTLRKNELVALLVDQDARKGGILVDFLGTPASTVRGPAMFAIRANCPIIMLSIHRAGNRHHAIFEAPIWPDPAEDEEASVLRLTRHFNDVLSRRIKEHPDEYFWPHRRWKSAMSQAAQAEKALSAT